MKIKTFTYIPFFQPYAHLVLGSKHLTIQSFTFFLQVYVQLYWLEQFFVCLNTLNTFSKRKVHIEIDVHSL